MKDALDEMAMGQPVIGPQTGMQAIDPVTGEQILTIPEWICDEKGWYEGTEVNIEVENDCIIIRDLDN